LYRLISQNLQQRLHGSVSSYTHRRTTQSPPDNLLRLEMYSQGPRRIAASAASPHQISADPQGLQSWWRGATSRAVPLKLSRIVLGLGLVFPRSSTQKANQSLSWQRMPCRCLVARFWSSATILRSTPTVS